MRYPCLMLNIILFYFLHRNRINTNFTLKEFLSWYPTLMVFRFWDCPKGLTSASVGRWWRLGREGNLNLGKIYLKLNPRELVGWMWPEENTPSCCSINTSVMEEIGEKYPWWNISTIWDFILHQRRILWNLFNEDREWIRRLECQCAKLLKYVIQYL